MISKKSTNKSKRVSSDVSNLSVSSLQRIILKNDRKVKMSKGKMMGEEGVLFHEGNDFKYAITHSPLRITFHAMPMYCNERIQQKYKPLFIGASFGKGCIRFKPHTAVSQSLLASFVKDCSVGLS